MIELKNIRKVFNQGKPNEFQAINDISLNIEEGEITCLKGGSGSGKTTLLSIIGCLSRPSSGRILLDQDILSGLPERFLTDIRRHTFGFIFQKFNLIQGLSVLENVMIPAYPLGLNHSDLTTSAESLLEQFGIRDKADNPVEWLSGGEAQRVAICRALINQPRILIADEPTANLDTTLSVELMGLLSKLKSNGMTILVTSHDHIVFDAPCVDRVVEILDGRLLSGKAS